METSNASLHYYLSSSSNLAFKSAQIVLGVVALLANFSLTIAILRVQHWRTSHIHIYYLTLLAAHLISSIGHIALGVSGLSHAFDWSLRQLRLLRCAIVTIPYVCGNLAYMLVLLAISIDRLIVVLVPMFYRLRFRVLQRTSICFAFFLSLAFTSSGFTSATVNTAPICGLTEGGTSPSRFARLFVVVSWTTSLCVSVLYTFSIIVLKCYQRRRSCGTGAHETEIEERFTRSATMLVLVEFLTSTLGLSAMSLVAFTMKRNQLRLELLNACQLVIQVNAVVNPFVIVWQHKHLRSSLNEVFCGRSAVDEASESDATMKQRFGTVVVHLTNAESSPVRQTTKPSYEETIPLLNGELVGTKAECHEPLLKKCDSLRSIHEETEPGEAESL